MQARPATPDDAAAIARIYNQGIADRIATFETSPRTEADGVHPIVVVEQNAARVAFAATFSYRPRASYSGIAETSVYVDREVGIYEKHGQLDGQWKDVIIVERLLSGAGTLPAAGSKPANPAKH